MDQNCNVIWSFGDAEGHIQKFADTFQWEEWHQTKKINDKLNLKQAPKADGSVGKSGQKVKLSNKEKFELDNMEKNIADEEKKLAAFQTELADSKTQTNYARLGELTKLVAESESKLENYFSRWTLLNEKANS